MKLIATLMLSACVISAANACEIEPRLKKCMEVGKWANAQIEVQMEGTKPSDFNYTTKFKSYLVISYTGKFDSAKTGQLKITRPDGTVEQRAMSIKATEYDHGYKAVDGIKSILSEVVKK